MVANSYDIDFECKNRYFLKKYLQDLRSYANNYKNNKTLKNNVRLTHHLLLLHDNWKSLESLHLRVSDGYCILENNKSNYYYYNKDLLLKLIDTTYWDLGNKMSKEQGGERDIVSSWLKKKDIEIQEELKKK